MRGNADTVGTMAPERALNHGFSLIELMIVVAVVGILAAIAYPSYQEHVVRTKRADAMAALMSASEALERYKANNNFNYGGASLAGGGGTVVFTNQVPTDGGTPYYNLALSADPLAAGATVYTLTATPTGSMDGKDGNLTITQTGARTWTDKAGTHHDCWPKGGSGC